MPRDFVPCLYHEREMYDAVLQVWHRRYEVTEGFSMADRVTQEPYVTLTRDSHASHVGVSESALDRLLWPTLSQRYEAQRRIDRESRTRLFDTFYAAMAALE